MRKSFTRKLSKLLKRCLASGVVVAAMLTVFSGLNDWLIYEATLNDQ